MGDMPVCLNDQLRFKLFVFDIGNQLLPFFIEMATRINHDALIGGVGNQVGVFLEWVEHECLNSDHFVMGFGCWYLFPEAGVQR